MRYAYFVLMPVIGKNMISWLYAYVEHIEIKTKTVNIIHFPYLELIYPKMLKSVMYHIHWRVQGIPNENWHTFMVWIKERFLCHVYYIKIHVDIVTWHLLGHAIKSVIRFDLQFWRSTRPMTSFCIFIAYINTEGILFNVKITRWD